MKRVLLFLLILSAFSCAAEWLTDTTVGTENNYAKIEVWPPTSYNLITQTQYMNLTSKVANAQTVNVTFFYDREEITNPHIWLWDTWVHLKEVSNPFEYDCSGNSTNLYTNVTEWVSQNCTDENITMQNMNYSDWRDVSGYADSMVYQGKKVHTFLNQRWEGGETKTLKIIYDTPLKSSGKFDVVFYKGSPAQLAQGTANEIIRLDPWWNSSWAHKIKCSVNTTVTSNLTDFPAYCLLNTSDLISDGEMLADCNDTRVLDSDEDAALAYEVESCNLSSSSPIWFKLTNAAANVSNDVYIYWGNPLAANAENASDVFSNNYTLINHMSKNVSNEIISSVGANFTKQAGTVTIESSSKCTFGTCIYLDGSTWMSTAHSDATSISNSEQGGFNFYFNPYNVGAQENFWMKRNACSTVQYAVYEAGTSTVYLTPNAFVTGQVSNNTYYLARAIDTTTSRAYTQNASGKPAWSPSSSTATTAVEQAAGNTEIGRNGGCGAVDGKGYMDEVRIWQGVNRTVDWLTAEYAQTYTLGSEEANTFFVSQTPSNNTNVTSNPVQLAFNSSVTMTSCYMEINSTNTTGTVSSSYTCLYNMTNPQVGIYTVKGWANDSGTWSATNETRNFSFYNAAPSISGLAITPASPLDNESLTCAFSAVDTDSPSMTSSFSWYRGGILQSLNSSESLNAYCYQESANASAAGDGSCGLNYGGAYSFSGDWANTTKLVDGNWSTSSISQNEDLFFINYTKPANATSSSYWTVLAAGTTPTYNLTIDNSCWAYSDTLQFRINASFLGGYFNSGCYNGTGWVVQDLDGGFFKGLYEEAMWWYINSTQTSATIGAGNTSAGDDWSCTAGLTDLTSSLVTSSTSNVSIQDITPPVVNSFAPTDGNFVAPKSIIFSLNLTDDLLNKNATLYVDGTSYGAMANTSALSTDNIFNLTLTWNTSGSHNAYVISYDNASNMVQSANYTFNVSTFTVSSTRSMDDVSISLTFPYNAIRNITVNHSLILAFTGTSTATTVYQFNWTDGNATNIQTNSSTYTNATDGVSITSIGSGVTTEYYWVSYTVENVTINASATSNTVYVNVTTPNDLISDSKYLKIDFLMPSSWVPGADHVQARSGRTGSWAVIGDGNLEQGENVSGVDFYNFTTYTATSTKDTVSVWLDLEDEHILEFTIQDGREDTGIPIEINEQLGGGGGGGSTLTKEDPILPRIPDLSEITEPIKVVDFFGNIDTWLKETTLGVLNALIIASIFGLTVAYRRIRKQPATNYDIFATIVTFTLIAVYMGAIFKGGVA